MFGVCLKALRTAEKYQLRIASLLFVSHKRNRSLLSFFFVKPNQSLGVKKVENVGEQMKWKTLNRLLFIGFRHLFHRNFFQRSN